MRGEELRYFVHQMKLIGRKGNGRQITLQLYCDSLQKTFSDDENDIFSWEDFLSVRGNIHAIEDFPFDFPTPKEITDGIKKLNVYLVNVAFLQMSMHLWLYIN